MPRQLCNRGEGCHSPEIRGRSKDRFSSSQSHEPTAEADPAIRKCAVCGEPAAMKKKPPRESIVGKKPAAEAVSRKHSTCCQLVHSKPLFIKPDWCDKMCS